MRCLKIKGKKLEILQEECQMEIEPKDNLNCNFENFKKKKINGKEMDSTKLSIFLNRKPKSNVFEFKIKSKELDFYFQPELTEEEIKEGCKRPENVVGSYAAFYKTKKLGRTGKAFHIYRPFAIDANKKKVWCELEINKDILKVKVPNEFLKKAKYPVIIDPEWGYTDIGATEGGLLGDYMIGNGPHIPGYTGYVSWIAVYGAIPDGVYYNVGIYDDDSDYPGNLLGQSAGTETGDGTTKWNQASLTANVDVTSGTKYHLCWNLERIDIDAYYDTTDSVHHWFYSSEWVQGDMDDPYSSGATTRTRWFSVKANVIPETKARAMCVDFI